MNNIDLKTILEKHKMWLNDEDGGEMADLRGAGYRFPPTSAGSCRSRAEQTWRFPWTGTASGSPRTANAARFAARAETCSPCGSEAASGASAKTAPGKSPQRWRENNERNHAHRPRSVAGGTEIRHRRTRRLTIPPEGMVLKPGKLYLGRTVERTRTDKFIPMLEGRSSVGRLGMGIHVTAGFGDIGFDGPWTLEITVTEPLRIYPLVEIAQIYYHWRELT